MVALAIVLLIFAVSISTATTVLSNITCASNTDCIVDCNTSSSCGHIYIDGSTATSLTLNCSASSSCWGSIIQCPDADTSCSIFCSAEKACTYIKIFTNTLITDQLIFSCYGYGACSEAVIQLNSDQIKNVNISFLTHSYDAYFKLHSNNVQEIQIISIECQICDRSIFNFSNVSVIHLLDIKCYACPYTSIYGDPSNYIKSMNLLCDGYNGGCDRANIVDINIYNDITIQCADYTACSEINVAVGTTNNANVSVSCTGITDSLGANPCGNAQFHFISDNYNYSKVSVWCNHHSCYSASFQFRNINIVKINCIDFGSCQCAYFSVNETSKLQFYGDQLYGTYDTTLYMVNNNSNIDLFCNSCKGLDAYLFVPYVTSVNVTSNHSEDMYIYANFSTEIYLNCIEMRCGHITLYAKYAKLINITCINRYSCSNMDIDAENAGDVIIYVNEDNAWDSKINATNAKSFNLTCVANGRNISCNNNNWFVPSYGLILNCNSFSCKNIGSFYFQTQFGFVNGNISLDGCGIIENPLDCLNYFVFYCDPYYTENYQINYNKYDIFQNGTCSHDNCGCKVFVNKARKKFIKNSESNYCPIPTYEPTLKPTSMQTVDNKSKIWIVIVCISIILFCGCIIAGVIKYRKCKKSYSDTLNKSIMMQSTSYSSIGRTK